MMNVRELMKDLVRISAPEISYDMEEVLMDCFVKKIFYNYDNYGTNI